LLLGTCVTLYVHYQKRLSRAGSHHHVEANEQLKAQSTQSLQLLRSDSDTQAVSDAAHAISSQYAGNVAPVPIDALADAIAMALERREAALSTSHRAAGSASPSGHGGASSASDIAIEMSCTL